MERQAKGVGQTEPSARCWQTKPTTSLGTNLFPDPLRGSGHHKNEIRPTKSCLKKY
jgi:hypothetical protein